MLIFLIPIKESRLLHWY